MPKAIQHAHKLKKIRYSTGNSIFFCTLPDCNFKSDTRLCLGKRAECWRCGKEFLINEYSIRLAKPHCNNCTKSKSEKINIEEVQSIAADSSTSEASRSALNKLREKLSKPQTAIAIEDEGDI